MVVIRNGLFELGLMYISGKRMSDKGSLVTEEKNSKTSQTKGSIDGKVINIEKSTIFKKKDSGKSKKDDIKKKRFIQESFAESLKNSLDSAAKAFTDYFADVKENVVSKYKLVENKLYSAYSSTKEKIISYSKEKKGGAMAIDAVKKAKMDVLSWYFGIPKEGASPVRDAYIALL
ncbi:hypothetical protein ACFL0W_00550 [Nanoarchaeota archaeon]